MTTPIVYDALRVTQLVSLPSSEEERKAIGKPPDPQKGFLTFFDPGWSILDLRTAVAGKEVPVFYKQDWYDNQDFALKTEPPRWRQIRMEAVPNSFSKSFDAQQKLLAKDEEVALARVVILGMVLHFLATGERLFPTYWVRCLDKSADGDRVYVGDFVGIGLGVYRVWRAVPVSDIGLACARKF
jgi:hypothetical protein